MQFFCWFAFLFLWTYATNTVAFKAFDTPAVESYTGITCEARTIESKNVVVNDSILILSHGTKMVSGVTVNGVYYPAGTVVANGNDTIVKDHAVVLDESGVAKVSFSSEKPGVATVDVDGTRIPESGSVKIQDYLSRMQGSVKVSTADIVAHAPDGSLSMEDASDYEISDVAKCQYVSKTVLNAASPEYNEAGNWLGLLYAVQALGSVAWAVALPRFRSRRFSYTLSLLLGGAGFIMTGFITNQYLLFVAFILIGCAWAAMLAWPFTILTNSLKGGNIGAYLGLFNCTICVPQIVAALVGGWILSALSTPGELAPEYLMMVVAGVSLVIGSICVFFIKEGDGGGKPQETPVESENI